LSQFYTLGPLPHPPFPNSLVASAAAGIGEEIIFRLFFISFWVWLISYVILKRRWQNQIFWIIAVFSALAFAFGHIPSVMVLFGLKTIGEIPPALMSEIFLLNSVVSIFAAYYFRKFGFLAAIGIHFWTDVIWHVIWGLI
jgi:CAAX amino terminal protease family.